MGVKRIGKDISLLPAQRAGALMRYLNKSS
jgi:hypothetical protein